MPTNETVTEPLTPEMLSLIAQLGALVKADPRCAEIEHAIEESYKTGKRVAVAF